MRSNFRSIALVVVVVLSAATVGVGTVGAAGDTEVSVVPGNASVDTGDRQTFEVVVESGGDGSQGYDLTVSLDNGTVGEIVAADTAGNPGLEDEVTINSDNSSVNITAGYLNPLSGAQPLTIATVTVEGASVGSTDIRVESTAEIRDGNNQRYTITGFNAAELTVDGQSPSPDFRVGNLTAPDSVVQGEFVTATATVANDGTAQGTTTVTLSVNGTQVNSTSVQLAAGTARTVSLSADTSALDPGTYPITITADGSTVSANLTVAETAVSVQPDRTTVGVGGQRTFEIVVDNGTSGSQGYDLTVELTNGTAADIVAADTAGNPGLADSTAIGSNNDTVNVTGGYTTPLSGATPLTIATVTVEGSAKGTTQIAVTPDSRVRDGNNSPYVVSTFEPALLTVENTVQIPGASSPAQNADGDPLLEDVDGSGTADVFDAIALYNNRNAKVVQNNPQFFDFDGNGAVDVFDAIELYNEV